MLPRPRNLPKLPAAYRSKLLQIATGPSFAAGRSWAQGTGYPNLHANMNAASPPPASAAQTALPSTPDWTTDPVYQQILALGTRRVSDAEAAALAARKQELIGLGYDPALAGLYPDQATATAAKQNPFSTFSTLAQAYALNQQNLNEGLNKQNLFFSGYRGNQLQLQGQDYLRQQASAEQTARTALAQIAAQLLAAKQQVEDEKLAAQQDAYTRFLQSQVPATIGVAA